MKQVRIIERTNVDGKIEFVIQQKHWLFFWRWTDAWINSFVPSAKDTFSTLEEAIANLCYFDGSKPKEKVVF